jgi:DNA-binding response OmpR family regulator
MRPTATLAVTSRMPEKSEIPPGSSGPILVVDDDPAVLRMISRALQDEGLRVIAAANGRLAVERARLQPPDLVVLDMSLPLLGGADVAAELRATFGERLPILLITADGRPAEKARRLGAYAYLSKPFDVDEFVATVHRGLPRSPQ